MSEAERGGYGWYLLGDVGSTRSSCAKLERKEREERRRQPVECVVCAGWWWWWW